MTNLKLQKAKISKSAIIIFTVVISLATATSITFYSNPAHSAVVTKAKGTKKRPNQRRRAKMRSQNTQQNPANQSGLVSDASTTTATTTSTYPISSNQTKPRQRRKKKKNAQVAQQPEPANNLSELQTTTALEHYQTMITHIEEALTNLRASGIEVNKSADEIMEIAGKEIRADKSNLKAQPQTSNQSRTPVDWDTAGQILGEAIKVFAEEKLLPNKTVNNLNVVNTTHPPMSSGLSQFREKELKKSELEAQRVGQVVEGLTGHLKAQTVVKRWAKNAQEEHQRQAWELKKLTEPRPSSTSITSSQTLPQTSTNN
jgi:hypothetical protein